MNEHYHFAHLFLLIPTTSAYRANKANYSKNPSVQHAKICHALLLKHMATNLKNAALDCQFFELKLDWARETIRKLKKTEVMFQLILYKFASVWINGVVIPTAVTNQA